MMAARRVASDPAFQAKAQEFARDEVAPRVREAVEQAKPVVAETRQRVEKTAKDLRDVARQHPPTDDPKAFVKAAHDRLKGGG